MATFVDRAYLRHLIDQRLVTGPVLEIGALNWQTEHENLGSICRAMGLEWDGADIVAGEGLSLVVDLLDNAAVHAIDRRWSSVIVFNVLEHLYDPPQALTNALALVRPGGTCAVVTPAVWQLHDYPADYWRPMPDFYIEYAQRNGLSLPDEGFMWISAAKLFPISAFVDGKQKLLPAYENGSLLWGSRAALWSRAVHKVARTTGRLTPYPLSALGVVFRKPPA